MFPLADGNLREFWKEVPRPDVISTSRWISQQVVGLVDGLRAIHEYELRTSGRHGDIKPENILWYRSPPDGSHTRDHADDHWGTFVISDFGLSRFHQKTVPDKTKAKSVARSATYRPPECDIGDVLVTPAYDIWSLGCLLLEFVTWYLLGHDGVQRFSEARIRDENIPLPNSCTDDRFFKTLSGVANGQVMSDSATVKPVVNKVRSCNSSRN